MDGEVKVEVLDLTLDSDDEPEDKPSLPNKDQDSELVIVSDIDEASQEDKLLPIPPVISQEENVEQPLPQRSLRNLERDIEKAVEEIRKGGSLKAIASYYQVPEDVLYSQLIVSRDLPKETDLLSKKEEVGLVNWIIKSNQSNKLVLRHQLLEKVGKMRRVVKITPIFARSKFGRKWYDYFLKKYPEVHDSDGLLIPFDKAKQNCDTPNLTKLFEIKKAVVVLHDFKKQKDFNYTYNEKCCVFLPTKFNDLKKEDPEGLFKSEVTLPNKISEIKSDPYESESETSDSSAYTSPNNVSYDDSLGFRGFEEVDDITNIIGSIKNEKNSNSKPTCGKCQRSFCNKYKLQRHMFSHIPKELYTITCHKCLKTFPSKYHFLVHLKISHSEKTFECNQCGKVYKHQSSLSKHQKKDHSTKTRISSSQKEISCARFICDICDKAFNYKNSLEHHIMYGHMKEKKPYPCDVCKKKFIRPSLMLRHKLRHSHIKPFPCIHCGKTYPRRYLLREHTAICSKNKDKIKSVCGETSKKCKVEVVID